MERYISPTVFIIGYIITIIFLQPKSWLEFLISSVCYSLGWIVGEKIGKEE